jgi:hypothetical protein
MTMPDRFCPAGQLVSPAGVPGASAAQIRSTPKEHSMIPCGNYPSSYLTQSSGSDRLIEFFRKVRRHIWADFEPRVEPSKTGFFFASDMNEDSLTEAEILYISLIGMCM